MGQGGARDRVPWVCVALALALLAVLLSRVFAWARLFHQLTTGRWSKIV